MTLDEVKKLKELTNGKYKKFILLDFTLLKESHYNILLLYIHII